MNKYSVPFDLIGEKVNLRLTKNAVEVFYRGTRVAMHARHRTVLRDPVVKPEHMTPEHRKYLNYNESEFTSWGSSVGEHTASVVRYFLTSGKETEQGYSRTDNNRYSNPYPNQNGWRKTDRRGG